MRNYDLHAWLEKKRERELKQVERECRSLIKKGFVALDTETTGLSAVDEIIQIGIIDHSYNVLVDTKINPEIPINPRASAVHRMYREDVIDAPIFPQVYDDVCKALNGRTVVIYNAEFDKFKLSYMRVKHGLPPITCQKIVDIMSMYSTYAGEYSWRHKAYKWQPLPYGNHSAVGDAIALVKLIYRMAGLPVNL